jgi:hypothetical protein
MPGLWFSGSGRLSLRLCRLGRACGKEVLAEPEGHLVLPVKPRLGEGETVRVNLLVNGGVHYFLTQAYLFVAEQTPNPMRAASVGGISRKPLSVIIGFSHRCAASLLAAHDCYLARARRRICWHAFSNLQRLFIEPVSVAAHLETTSDISVAAFHFLRRLKRAGEFSNAPQRIPIAWSVQGASHADTACNRPARVPAAKAHSG